MPPQKVSKSRSQQSAEMLAKAQPRSAAATEHDQEAPLLKAEHAAFAPNIKDSRGRASGTATEHATGAKSQMAPKAICKRKVFNGFCERGCPLGYGLCHRTCDGKVCRKRHCRYVHPEINMPGGSGALPEPDQQPAPKKRPRTSANDAAKEKQPTGTPTPPASAPEPALLSERVMTLEVAEDVFNLSHVECCSPSLLGAMYRTLARESHPDKVKKGGRDYERRSHDATVKFRELTAAYEFLRPLCRQPDQSSSGSDMD